MIKPRVAFFVSHNDHEWFEKHVRNHFTEVWEIAFFSDTTASPIFKKLEDFHYKSVDQKFDICFFSLAPVAFSSREQWLTTLEQILRQESAVFFRAGTVKGLDVTYPPKMPFIDPSLIIFIPSKYAGKKRAEYFAHFRVWDPLYFDLYAYIENYYTIESFSNFDIEEQLLDKYGNKDGFSIDRFYYSPLSGLIAYPQNAEEKLIKVRDQLISGLGNNFFLKRPLALELYQRVKKYLMSMMKKNELVKKYDI